jgi:hypothetical protein
VLRSGGRHACCLPIGLLNGRTEGDAEPAGTAHEDTLVVEQDVPAGADLRGGHTAVERLMVGVGRGLAPIA